MSNFETAIAALLKNEGGYVNNPADKGGETKYGIAKKWHPEVDIKNLTVDGAKAIYKSDYWNPNNFDGINDAEIATAALDTVVNHGRGAFLLQLAAQRAGVPIHPDGKIGPATLSALNSLPASVYLPKLYEVRKEYYTDLVAKDPSQAKFLPGWLKRISVYDIAEGAGGLVALALLITAVYYLKRRNS
ncbi:MAG TPA: glycosyl hydrolase 108 family protein [Pyrinomonadaceae bacterium]|jgi:type VI secretion system secreted protein VgrG|nr:glycosyl hydrolase 108 family protein [Pyrinomonadaceae bacterium]